MRKYLALHIGGQKWGVYLVSRKHKALRGDCVGICVYDDCKIYIAKDLTAQVFEDTLLHELLHAVIYVSGGTNVLDAECRRDSAKAEEQIVRCMTPMLHRLLKDLGFLFPAK